MSRSTLARRGRRALTLATVAGVATAMFATGGGAAHAATLHAAATDTSGASPDRVEPLTAGNYLVTLAAPPAATYSGGVAGLTATRPAAGQRLDARSGAVQQYRNHLVRQQAALLRSTGVKARAQYTVALNGFSARLTAAQAAKLSANRGVLSVVKDTRRKITLFDTPDFLGLTGAKGTWNAVGGPAKAGRGVVVGVLDTGIWPENAFFRARRVTHTVPGAPGSTYVANGRIHVVKGDGGVFVGTCQAGERFPATTCNNKIVGARYYSEGFLAQVPRDQFSEHEFLSPRDGQGHGSHTASTAAGRQISGMTVEGRSFGASAGMAPAAKIAAYKVCWEGKTPETSGCADSDILQAIDDAVSDGVDVINFSIGGAPERAADPAELAFLNAAAAGVFVAASAGNSGPGASTVGHNSPWLTTVAASTVHRFEGTVQLGNGTKLRGASFSTTPVPARPAILASAAAAEGVTAANALLCGPNSLDPAKVTGKIVVCDRGVVDRVAKSAEVKRAGGVGMVLINPTPSSLNADLHAVPTVHLQNTDRAAVHAYLATPNPTIALLVGDQTGRAPTPLPVVAGFSSRGPDLTSEGDLLKPDITAPGVDVVAAVAPGPNNGNDFAPYSGTSMSSPHIAGLAALILGKHPRWSPATVKSAMMTTASNTKTENGKTNTNPFEQGAGHVNPRKFLNPGLVYNSGVMDWLGYLEGIGVDTGYTVKPIDGSNLNLPSIAVGGLLDRQTVTRRVTALSAGTYTASVSGLRGLDVKVSPSTLKLKRGQSANFTVSFTRRTAAPERYATGFLTWTSKGTTVRSPIAVQPLLVSAPSEVSGAGASGSTSYRVRAGVTARVDLRVAGLVAGKVTNDSVAIGPFKPERAGDAANKVYEVTVPANTTLSRFDLRAGDARDDLDMFLFNAAFQLVATAATPSPNERLDSATLPAGTYYVLVNGFASHDNQPAPFSLRTFAVGESAAGNLTATPDPLPVTQGRRATVNLAWRGLTAGTPYLGYVGYQGSDARTVVSIG